MKKLILAAILAAVMLTGCNIKEKDFKEYTTGEYFGYVADEHTGVVYIYTNHGITVALNADGSPVTKEQLEAWRGDNEHID